MLEIIARFTYSPLSSTDSFGKEKVIRGLREQIDSQLKSIVEEVVGLPEELEKFSDKLPPEVITQLIESSRHFFQQVINLPAMEERNALEQQVRLIALILGNRIHQFPAVFHDAVDDLLQEISQAVGKVPALNEQVPLPEQDFLPIKYQESSKNWQTVIYRDPGRDKKDSVSFFSKQDHLGQISSVRRQLLVETMNSRNPEEAFSFAESDYYAMGDLQVDHLQPSEEIIERQLELIMAMNIDPLFCEAMMKHPEAGKYFKKTHSHGRDEIVGTKYFFQVYHNCIDNLWLISTAANTGLGKLNQNPVDWLGTHPRYGARFFDDLGGTQAINRDSILYAVEKPGQKTILAKIAKEWFLNTYKEELAAAGYLREMTSTAKRKLGEVIQEPKTSISKRKKIKFMIRAAMAERLLQISSPTGSSSPSSSFAEINPENMNLIGQLVDKEFANPTSLLSLAKDTDSELSKAYSNFRKR
ncbi:MAG: hypothetical protein JSS53_07555 [Proteobacteria bacterium]|nr:hypothetical protein [Pseudomonadota bacterium]